MQKKSFASEYFESDKFACLSKESQLLFFHMIFKMEDNGIIRNARSLCNFFEISENALDELVDKKFLMICDDDLGTYFEICDYDKILGKSSRNTYKNQKWKDNVRARDGWKCVKCGSTKHLQVHHINAYSLYPEQRYDVSNGITLCYDCHLKEHKGDWHNV